MFTVRPLTARASSKIHRRALLDNARQEIVSPACDQSSSPAICLPNEFDRAIAFNPETTPEREFRRVSGLATHHWATVLHTVDDVILVDGAAYTLHRYLDVVDRPRRYFPKLQLREFDAAMMCSNYVIDRYFGHWIHDGLPREALASDRQLVPLTVSSRRWQHELAYRSILEREDVRVEAARVRQMTFVEDRGLNASWVARMTHLREVVHRKAASDGPAVRVFLARGSTGAARTLVNEREIMEALAALGYLILEPEKETSERIAAVLSRAELVVGVEGSGQAHQLLAAPVGSLSVAIMPPERFNASFKPFLDRLGMPWAYTVAEPRENKSFYQPLYRLLQTIDLAERSIH